MKISESQLRKLIRSVLLESESQRRVFNPNPHITDNMSENELAVYRYEESLLNIVDPAYFMHVRDNAPDELDWKEWLYHRIEYFMELHIKEPEYTDNRERLGGNKRPPTFPHKMNVNIIKKSGNKYDIDQNMIGKAEDLKLSQSFIKKLEKVCNEASKRGDDNSRINKYKGY